MKLHALLPETVAAAISLYQEIAYGTQSRARRAPDLKDMAGKDTEGVLAMFQKEHIEPVPGHPCVRYSLRLGNRNYPFMKLVLQEHIVAGEFFFAVDTHDQMDIKPDFPDYESWMAVRRFNRELKQRIEEAFDRRGLDTASCLRRTLEQRGFAPVADADCRGTALIVDDEVDLADAVELLLQAKGFRTVKIHDGRAAVAAVARILPTFVLLDYELPELDGLQVIAQLRSNPVTQGIPILLSSAAQVSLADIRKADGFLGKPFHEHLLHEMVDRIVKKGEVRA
jgi:CheY-like chemotaxis protein